MIGGKAVLPVAIMLEWLAHGAIHHNPGLELEGIEDFRVFHGVRLDRNGSAALKVLVGKPIRTERRFVIRTQLVGTAHGRDLVHAAGNLILTSGYGASSGREVAGGPAGLFARHGHRLRVQVVPWNAFAGNRGGRRMFAGWNCRGFANVPRPLGLDARAASNGVDHRPVVHRFGLAGGDPMVSRNPRTSVPAVLDRLVPAVPQGLSRTRE